MRVCGIEIKSDTATLVIASLEDGQFTHIPSGTKKIALADDDVSANVRSFANSIEMFLRDNAIDAVAIKKRNARGEFAGGAKTFKIEGVIQLKASVEVVLLSPQTITARERRTPFPSPPTLTAYQEESFRVACAFLSGHLA